VPVLSDTIQLTQGWNLIGSIGYPIPKSAVAQSVGGLVSSNYFAFNGVSGYGASDTLKPGRAYWVKASTAGDIFLDVKYTAGTVPVVPPEERNPDPGTMNSIALSGTAGDDAVSRLYFTPEVLTEAEAAGFDLPPLPPSGAFDVRFATNRFVASVSGGEIPILLQGAERPIRITASIVSGSYAIVEKTGGVVTATHSLTDGGTFVIDAAPGKRFSIIESGLPAAFALGQNYPNPFNPTTTLRYSLPVDGIISLTVYNILGERIAVPIRAVATTAGYHSVDIDASSWPTGTYFVSFNVSGSDGRTFTQGLKMLLVR
ncbi:MAG TPA: T9SS type A sorting domain-containing protein, partial [Bacteroidota bacterium]|nr:T9SS type A sorting domain-containing protein [Bacteroidota bacterium]